MPGDLEDPIRCRFQVVSLDDELPIVYGALTYTWGDGNSDRRVLVDGKVIFVKPNLEAALLEFRRMPPELPPLDWYEKLQVALRRLLSLEKQLSEKSQRMSKIFELSWGDNLKGPLQSLH